MITRIAFPRRFLAALLMVAESILFAAEPVEFSFRVEHSKEENPFSREVWAEIETPSAQRLQLPAFYAGDFRWTVRTRSAEKGNYRFLGAQEVVRNELSTLSVSLQGKDRIKPRDTDDLGPALRVDPRTGTSFSDGSGQVYVPLGGNLPWADTDEVVDFYQSNLRSFGTAGLNWTRIWMCHWGQLNLDWREPHHSDNPPLGHLDLEVARSWDQIIASADAANIRVQMVLQHHDQYSSAVNSDWDANPWNSANGGFLDSPQDFFTDEQALQLTRDKYRYIVARWGYSSAIMAWELFNEVMWTDSRKGDSANNASVAQWHTDMARHIRRFDVQGHLITTSDDDLNHGLWNAMDYYQPHLYASNMVLGPQTLHHPPSSLDRPIFYGEIGDNNMVELTDAQRADGAAHIPIAWAGLFGEATQPAQLWYIDVLRQNGRMPELFSLAEFARASGLLQNVFNRTSHPTVIGGDLTSWCLSPGHTWARGSNPVIDLPVAGYEGAELMEFRRILTDASATPAHPYPNRVTFRFSSPAAARTTLKVANVSNSGSSLRVDLDGKTVVQESWPALTVGAASPSDVTYDFRIGYGQHELVIENPNGPEWVDLAELNLGINVPALIAIARHTANRSIIWVRHRDQLLSTAADEYLLSSRATLQLKDYPAGNWEISWWDPADGRVISSQTFGHSGGTLSLDTPSVSRHLAAWIEPTK